jgi:hypothetical protein
MTNVIHKFLIYLSITSALQVTGFLLAHLQRHMYNFIPKCTVIVVSRHNTPIHNILSTAPQLNISQKALGTLPEDGNVMPKHVGATIHN